MRECECGTRLDEQEECPACNAAMRAARARYRRGDWRAAMEPPPPWRSRGDLIRDGFED